MLRYFKMVERVTRPECKTYLPSLAAVEPLAWVVHRPAIHVGHLRSVRTENPPHVTSRDLIKSLDVRSFDLCSFCRRGCTLTFQLLASQAGISRLYSIVAAQAVRRESNQAKPARNLPARELPFHPRQRSSVTCTARLPPSLAGCFRLSSTGSAWSVE